MSGSPHRTVVVIRHTAAFKWTHQEEPESFPERLTFIREVLFGLLGLIMEDIICVQRNQSSAFFYVTCTTEEGYKKMLAACSRLEEDLRRMHYDVEPLWKLDRRVITVHVLDPFVPAEAVAAFLGRFVDVVPGHRDVRDQLGVWTGRRQFRVCLRPDASSPDGYSHPPAFFIIGRCKGYLFYSGQPSSCRLCHGLGHTADSCTTMKCWRCLDVGHLAKDCKGPLRCNLCRGEDHLARSCPQRKPSWADAVARGSAVDGARQQALSGCAEMHGGAERGAENSEEQPFAGADGESTASSASVESPGKGQVAVAEKRATSPSRFVQSRRRKKARRNEDTALGREAIFPVELMDLQGVLVSPQERRFYAGQQDIANERSFLVAAESGGDLSFNGDIIDVDNVLPF